MSGILKTRVEHLEDPKPAPAPAAKSSLRKNEFPSNINSNPMRTLTKIP